MSTDPARGWQPTRAAALEQLAGFVPRAAGHYARSRNLDEGWHEAEAGPQLRQHVSGLSPWLQRRVLLEAEVVRDVVAAHGPTAAMKFVEEVLWRTYFKGWLALRPSVWEQYDEDRVRDLQRLQLVAPRSRHYDKAVAGATGIDCFDHWVRELQQTGYLHNHARMWFASIWVFTLRLPWTLGAALFQRHLLDFDPASNTLGWRWVAGLHTRGKAYAARASNIEKLTDGRFDPRGKLNEHPEALREDFEHPMQPLELRPAPDPGPRTGVLLTTEDLVIEHSELRRLPVVAIAGGLPEALTDADTFAPRVQRFTAAALDDGLRRAGRHFALDPMRLTDGPAWIDAVIDWARRHELERVAMMAPQVGPWEDPVARLASALGARGVTLTQTRRAWDRDLYPSATKGFFRFKRVIPDLVRRAAG